MANETGQLQAQSIREQSERSMMQMTEQSMTNLATQAAANTDGELWELRKEAEVLAAQVEAVFLHPSLYGEHRIERPKMTNAGKPALQLMMS